VYVSNGYEEASLMLARFGYFEECFLEAVEWLNFGTVLNLVFDVVRDEFGQLRPDLDVPWHVGCRMVGLMNIDLDNQLSPVLLDDLDAIDFWRSEITFAELSEVHLGDRTGVKLRVHGGSQRELNVVSASISIVDLRNPDLGCLP
jgi:hypothetical protein